MTKPNQRLRQVAGALVGSSLRHPFFWMWFPFVPTLSDWPRFIGEHPPLNWAAVGFLAGIDTPILLGGYLANYRWRLLPHYGRVYLATGAVLAAGLVALPAAWSIWCAPQAALPCVGLGFLMFSLGCWADMRRMGLPILIFLIALAGIALAWPAQLGAAVESWPGNLVCLAAGWILLTLFARWLLEFDEDRIEYAYFRHIASRSMGAWLSTGKFATRRPSVTRTPATRNGGLMAGFREWRLERAIERGPGGFAWNVRRWSVISIPPLFPLLAIPLVAIAVLVARRSADSRTVEFVAIAVPWAVGALVLMLWIDFRRRPTLAIESLRPVTRSDFVRQWGCGLLVQLACLVVVNIVLAMCAFGPSLELAPPGALAWWSLWTALPFALAGLLSWLRTYGPVPWELVVGLLVAAMFLGAGIVVASVSAQRGPIVVLGSPPVVTVGLLLAGTALFWATYRRWLVVDLD